MKHYLLTGGIMNLRTLFVWSAVLSLTAIMACDEPTGVDVVLDPGEASVSGKVVRQDDTPIADASVLLSTTLGSQSTSSDLSGQYSFIFVFDTIQAAVSAKILVTKAGFSRDSSSFFLAPGNALTDLNFVLVTDTGGIQPPPPDTVGVGGPSGPASNIVVAALSRDNVSVRGAGGAIENARITFEARD
ncbi:MAG: carboxypeptidase-like regulatory domain-containing protein, partial [Bacteroidota bacterium]